MRRIESRLEGALGRVLRAAFRASMLAGRLPRYQRRDRPCPPIRLRFIASPRDRRLIQILEAQVPEREFGAQPEPEVVRSLETSGQDASAGSAAGARPIAAGPGRRPAPSRGRSPGRALQQGLGQQPGPPEHGRLAGTMRPDGLQHRPAARCRWPPRAPGRSASGAGGWRPAPSPGRPARAARRSGRRAAARRNAPGTDPLPVGGDCRSFSSSPYARPSRRSGGGTSRSQHGPEGAAQLGGRMERIARHRLEPGGPGIGRPGHQVPGRPGDSGRTAAACRPWGVMKLGDGRGLYPLMERCRAEVSASATEPSTMGMLPPRETEEVIAQDLRGSHAPSARRAPGRAR